MEMSLNAMVLFLIEFNIIAESFDHKKSSRRGGRRVTSHFEWVVGQPQCAVQFALSIFGGCRRNSMIIKSIHSHCAALQFSSSSLVAGCCLWHLNITEYSLWRIRGMDGGQKSVHR